MSSLSSSEGGAPFLLPQSRLIKKVLSLCTLVSHPHRLYRRISELGDLGAHTAQPLRVIAEATEVERRDRIYPRGCRADYSGCDTEWVSFREWVKLFRGF